MANQRAQVGMTHDEQVAFLDMQRSSTLATYGPQGQIHLVGMGTPSWTTTPRPSSSSSDVTYWRAGSGVSVSLSRSGTRYCRTLLSHHAPSGRV